MNSNNKRKNFFIIGMQDFEITNDEKINKIVQIINKDRLAIVSGLRNVGKMNLIKELLSKTGINNNYFYFNKSDDIENYIQNSKDLNNLLNDYIKLYKKPNIIIFQNIDKIEGIKDFLGKIYSEGHKIILIGNNIKIGGIKEVEITNIYKYDELKIDNIIKYGGLREINQVDNVNIKRKLLKTTSSDILLHEICSNFSVKNIELYKYTLTYLSENNNFSSLRELQKSLDEVNKISLKTLIDYINFSLQTKILKRSYRFDLKKSKAITSKAKYYFSDNGIRNSFNNFEIKNHILIENLIFNILEYNNYSIYGGLNGKFEFTFYIEKENSPLSNIHKENETSISIEKKYIHISTQNSKEEVRKEVNKLLKIGKEGKKYLIVESIKNLGIKKLQYDSVEILEVETFINKFTK